MKYSVIICLISVIAFLVSCDNDEAKVHYNQENAHQEEGRLSEGIVEYKL